MSKENIAEKKPNLFEQIKQQEQNSVPSRIDSLKESDSDESEQRAIRSIAAKRGFTEREKGKKKTSYTDQYNVRCRKGMSELVNDISYALKSQKQKVFERAILALLEKNDLIELIDKYNRILKN